MYYPELDVHDVDDHPQFFGTEASPFEMSIPDEGTFSSPNTRRLLH